MNISQILTKLKSLVYSKSEADTLLSSKASSSHKHTKSEITDFPTIPTKTSQLTNDSRFLTSNFSTTHTRGTAPENAVYKDFLDYRDSASNRICLLESVVSTDKSSMFGMYAYNTSIASGGNIGYLGIGSKADGTVLTHAPTPAASDSSTQIATTAWVNSKGYLTSHQSLSGYVPKSGGNIMTGSLGPSTSGGASLGDSSHKWSKINGVAPGALGLPGSGVNITSLFNSRCQWTAYANGWVMALATYTGSDQIGAFFLKTSDMKISFGDESPTRYVAYSSNYTTMAPRAIFLPVKNGQTVTAIIKAITTTGQSTKYDRKPTMWFYPCVGNV